MEQAIRDRLTAGGMDVAKTLARFGGNENLLMKYIRRFPTDKTYGALKEAMEAGNRDTVKTTCHTLKGLCGSLGLTPLFDACSDMMTLLRASDDTDPAPAFARVTDEYLKALALVDGI